MTEPLKKVLQKSESFQMRPKAKKTIKNLAEPLRLLNFTRWQRVRVRVRVKSRGKKRYSHSNDTPTILHRYFHGTSTILQILQYSNDTPSILPWYFNDTPMVLQRHSVFFLEYWKYRFFPLG